MNKITFSFIIILLLISIPGCVGIDIADSYTVRAATKPDLTVQDITWSPVEPSKGDNVTLTITIKNQGGAKAISCRVYFYVDGHFKSYQYMQSLAPGDLVTESFTWVAEAGTHTIKVIADGENWIKESDEDNNVKTVTIQTIPPDLIIQSITWSPQNISEGDNVTFTVKITNQGNGQADYSYVAYYVDDLYLTSADVIPLDPGATDNKTFNWFAEAGAHTIKVVADPNNRVLESNETNNERTIVFPTLSPDLIVSSITWSPINPPAGETVTFTVTIRNQGIARADHSTIHYYIGDHDSGNQHVESIAAGALATSTFTWKARAGLHVIKVVADPYNNIIEVNENNNEKIINFAGALPPDLTVQNIALSPENPQEGDEVTLTVTIKNQGSGKADYFYVAYYIDERYLSSAYVIPLDPGGTYNKTFTWAAEAGTHTIKVVADSDNRITESNETNNEKTIVFPTPSPRVSKPSPASSTEKQATPTETAPVVKSKPNGSSEKESSTNLWIFVIPIAFLITSLVLIILKSQSR